MPSDNLFHLSVMKMQQTEMFHADKWTYLSFRQTEVNSQFRLPPDGDVSVEMKLLLQLQSLMVCVNYPVFLLRSCFTCEGDTKQRTQRYIFAFFLQPSGITGAGCMPRRAYLRAASL